MISIPDFMKKYPDVVEKNDNYEYISLRQLGEHCIIYQKLKKDKDFESIKLLGLETFIEDMICITRPIRQKKLDRILRND